MEQGKFQKEFEPGTQICIAATAAVGKENPVSIVHSKMLLIFVVDRASGVIEDFDVNTACDLTKRFLRSIFLGKNLITETDVIRREIMYSYLGASSRALVVATRNARERLLDHCAKAEGR